MRQATNKRLHDRNIAEFLDAIGGIEALAREYRLTVAAVEHWIHLGSIPTGWHMRFFARGLQCGVVFDEQTLDCVFGFLPGQSQVIARALGTDCSKRPARNRAARARTVQQSRDRRGGQRAGGGGHCQRRRRCNWDQDQRPAHNVGEGLSGAERWELRVCVGLLLPLQAVSQLSFRGEAEKSLLRM